MNTISIALAGNPNCGKTTLFNALTGSKQRVGNWPGVTVEHKEGNYTFRENQVKVTDLPGIYSFSAYSPDEKVARNFILQEKPDMVVNIIDASNLERNLYLTTQLIEMKVPVLIALNMMDVAEQRKIRIEVEHLKEHLEIPIVQIIASKKKGIDELKEHIASAVTKHQISSTKVEYDSVVEAAICRLQPSVETVAQNHQIDSRWLVIKALEKDAIAAQFLTFDFTQKLQDEVKKIEKHTGMDVDIVMADGRYGFIHGLARDVLHRDFELRKNISDAVDKVVLNRFLGVPLFLIVMYLVFFITIQIGAPFITFFEIIFEAIFVNGFRQLLTILNFPEWIITLLSDGIGGGIQTVATFIPPIFFMFLSLSFLEDSGYMSRAAFIMDRYMRKIGLPGKAFIPLLVGFGCNVPAIMASRTLENRKDRILTIMINPFMSCGARLPVYAVFASVFFAQDGTIIIFSLYAIGVLLAITSGYVLQRTILKGTVSSFVMELPPYHIPTMNGIMLHTWQRLQSFVIRAGKVILLVVLILSFFNSVAFDGSFGNENTEKSILSCIGKAITPVFKPMGINEDNWPATVGLITGIFAKETVIGTLDALYATQDEFSMSEQLPFYEQIITAFSEFYKEFIALFVPNNNKQGVEITETRHSELAKRFGSKINAYAYLLFILIYAPCLAVIAAIYKELNAKWAYFSLFFLTFLGWIIATVYYQGAMLFRQPAISLFWLVISGSMLLLFYLLLKYDMTFLKKDVQKEI
jgi:ferrous iron transport protein B